MKNLLRILLASVLLASSAFGQSTLTVNAGTGAIAGPVSAATFRSANTIQSLDTDLTSWAAITRGTGFDAAAALNVGSAGAFVTFNGAGGTPSSITLTNASGTAASLTAGSVTTNANLTGDVTSSGNAATVANIPVTATHATSNTTLPTNTGGWTEYFVTSSPATTTQQTLQNITGMVSGTLSNSTKYEIEVVIDATTSADTTGIKYGISCGGTGSAGVVQVFVSSSSTSATAVGQYGIAAVDTGGTTVMTTSAQTGQTIMKGMVTTRSTGTATIIIQHLKVTSGTSTVLVGSVFRIRKAHT